MAPRVWSPVQYQGVCAELSFIDMIIDFMNIVAIIFISIIGRSNSLLAHSALLVQILIGDPPRLGVILVEILFV